MYKCDYECVRRDSKTSIMLYPNHWKLYSPKDHITIFSYYYTYPNFKTYKTKPYQQIKNHRRSRLVIKDDDIFMVYLFNDYDDVPKVDIASIDFHEFNLYVKCDEEMED